MRLSSEIKIAILALVASLVFSLVMFPLIAESQRAHIDPDRFGELGLGIANGNGFAYTAGGPPVFERAPLYSFVVAGVFSVVGNFSLLAVQIVQALFQAFTSYIIFLIGSRVFSRRTALIGQTLYAFHPIALWYTARIWVETTHTLLLCVVVLCVMMLLESPSLWRSALAGVAIGLSCLTKPMLLLFPFVVLAMVATMQQVKNRWAVGFSVVVACAVTILPWTIRNYNASGELVLVNTSLGFNLIQGDVIGDDWPSPNNSILDYWSRGAQRADSLLSPERLTWESVKGDRLLIVHVTESYLSHPIRLAKKVPANFFTFWYLSESTAKSVAFGFFQVALLIAGLVSYIRLGAKQKRLLIPVVALVVYSVAINVSIVGWARYSMPLIPFLAILASPLLGRYISFGGKE